MLIICCFCVGEWICKACANGLGLKTGIEGHEWKLEDEVDDNDKIKDKERRPPFSEEEEEDDDQVNFVATTLVDSDDEEMPVRGKKRRRKVLEVDSSDDE